MAEKHEKKRKRLKEGNEHPHKKKTVSHASENIQLFHVTDIGQWGPVVGELIAIVFSILLHIIT
jgi:hypothetical protein